MPIALTRKIALKCIKIYLRSILGNNRLHALLLVHAYNNILDNIKLADVANQFVNRKDIHKLSDIYLINIY